MRVVVAAIDGLWGRVSIQGWVELSRVDGYPVYEVCDCFVAFAAAHVAVYMSGVVKGYCW